MSVAFKGFTGLAFYDIWRAFNGFTLLTPFEGKSVRLVDMKGRETHHWETEFAPATYGELLPNGNLLYAGKAEDGHLKDIEGAGGVLMELDWDGNVIWEYRDSYLHDGFCRMKNGNTLVIKWVEVPREIAARVKGREPSTERNGVMWGDVIQEITPDGRMVWEWIAHEHLDPEKDLTCPLCPRITYAHANCCEELPNGNILVSFMKNNTISVIEKETGKIIFSWGQDELAHQHSVSILDNGNLLVFDNGYHPKGFAMGESRVLEVNPSTTEMVWTYTGPKGVPQFFYSSIVSSCQRLPNGNTLICEGTSGRLFEVTAEHELVWEYVLPQESSSNDANHGMIYGAYRYGLDYSGLKRPVPLPEERQPQPGAPSGDEEAGAVQSRLELLGY
ncbi:MAG: aryl-sulfate sulfotransferase [Deltaproteobacteria bacterium]|nr:aryl-sulfate sulfotransferase [Deltaproteobacteria bacterium]